MQLATEGTPAALGKPKKNGQPESLDDLAVESHMSSSASTFRAVETLPRPCFLSFTVLSELLSDAEVDEACSC